MRRRLSLVSAGASVAALGLVTPAVQPAAAASPDVVISQVYGGGGNSGAPWTHDYVELFNRGSAPVSLAGWSVQYASATGTGLFSGHALPAVVLQPGRYLLVQESGGTTGAPLPTPDVVGSVAMSAAGGKVAVVRQTAGLGCNGGSTPCSDTQKAQVVDLVGYGSANFFEGSAAAPAPSNTTAVTRAGQGCHDTDDNGLDFTTVSPAPRNSASAVLTCTGGPGDPPPSGTPARIRDIQGTAHLSPMRNQDVVGVPGVVTAVQSRGFWFQDVEPDADDATSEGLFVFTSTAPGVRVGDAVTVSGHVTEFRPGGSGGGDNLTTTEVTTPRVTVLSSGNALPPATVVGAGGRVPPSAVIDDDSSGDVETTSSFDPADDGLDFDESLEGMRVSVADAVATGPTSGFGEIPVVSEGAASVRTARGGLVIRAEDLNPERLVLDDALAATPTVDVGDRLDGVTGVMDYSFGGYKLLVTATPTVVAGGLTPETTAAAGEDDLAVATFNVENLDARDPQQKFDRLARLVVDNLKAPDLISLEEVQDGNGATNDSVVDATATTDRLVAALVAAGGPTYEYADIDPVDDRDGGEPGGNIRVGFLYRTDRGLELVDTPGGGATTATRVLPGPHLSASPGRIDPTNAAFSSSRKPLVGEFTFRGVPLFVVGNHFSSKGGDDPLFGRTQPPVRSSETQRRAQAQVVHDFVAELLAADPRANVVVLGDLNDFPWSDAVRTLQAGVLHNLVEGLPVAERYTYVFEGNSQALDHVLVSGHLAEAASPAYDAVHVNAEFADQASDHDPSVARLGLDGPPVLDLVTAGPTVECGQGASLTATFRDPAPADTHDAIVAWGDGTTETFQDVSSPFTATHTYAHAGSYEASVTVSDGSASAGPRSATLVTAYGADGGRLLPPLDREHTARYGQVVPVKVVLRDCDGITPDELAPRVAVNGPHGPERPASPSVDGTTMRFDATSGTWVYPLDTGSLSAPDADYRVLVTVPETGQTVTGALRTRR